MKVFKKVEKQLPQLTTLDLQYVSPELLKARNLELAVPGKCQGNKVFSHESLSWNTGTYQSGKETITITNFAPKLSIIISKQRPRRLYLKGSDGKEYQYVLKGAYDLRGIRPILGP
jgi:FKBP12-rapamycin complex-associated protein